MNIDANVVGLVAGVVALGGVVWKMARTVADFSATVETMKGEFKEMKSSFDRFPVLEHRVKRIEEQLDKRGGE